ncbi:glycosyl transferase [Acinetobacter qingfengensis]|uniref:Glycosyl transferase n=1 Tax=Acinetobacter qingfengensis TaxID=1262585 RepID=A0A1E7REP2_9GAMM|nr:glycosyl transferase [Acinetobacter qingfengensis]KAA8735041.1 glycosyl transferase [Acinetobacter qingfengensis]OEY97763.1 glycosyl transferase [Acinetobacter qingfengensis]
MSDFYQNGLFTNFHNLTERSTEDLEQELISFSKRRKMGLILPSLFSELEGPALNHIVDELSQATYLEEIVIGLDRADREQFLYAQEFFSRLPQRYRILWNDGPRLRAIDEKLQKEGLSPTEAGKGRNVWYCMGYTLASDRTDCIALHDCDIVTYDRGMLARLIYPVANPTFQYVFCKGYYSRLANQKLNGRVCRLLVGPLLRALQMVYGHSEYLEYLNNFRYPLSGEFAMRTRVLNSIKIPSDWGLEIGVLSEIYRNYSPKRSCQVEIADNYDHKHQPLANEDGTGGLKRMSCDIIQSLLRKLATMGVSITSDSFRILKATYYRNALDIIEIYHHDAEFNGLKFDQHSEEMAVELFTQCILDAGQAFIDRPNDQPFIPGWNRVESAFPNIFQEIYDAVEDDHLGNI